MPVLLLTGFCLSSCCSPKECEVKVKFLGVHEDLDLEDYSYNVPFNTPTTISMDIPAGYDHTKAKASINNHEQAGQVTFEKEIEDEYKYAISKNIKYNIKFVKRSFELIIDLTEMQKLKFDIIMPGMSDFQVITFSDKERLDRLTVLNSLMADSTINFKNEKASVEYGDYAFLIRTHTSKHYDSLYSRVGRFTQEEDISHIGSLNYIEYPVAKKGNVRYYLNNNGYTSIHYMGQILEDVELSDSIPEYVPDKGFDIQRDPNIFYLFSNLSQYNSDLLTIETYTSSNNSYNASNQNLDKIGNVTIEKVNPHSIYKNRYDLHKIYLGANIATDGLLKAMQKSDVRQDIYIKVTSKIGVENFNLKLLKYEGDTKSTYNVNADQISVRGEKYIKLTEEDLMEFSIEREHEDQYGQMHTYYSGSAIFYPQLKYSFFSSDHSGTYKYSRVWLKKSIINGHSSQLDDYNFFAYVKDEYGNKKYGIIDYHYEGDSPTARDCVYLETADLFDENKVYKNTLYCEVIGKKYEDYSTQLITNLSFSIGQFSEDSLNPDGPVIVENPKVYNGYKDFPIIFRSMEYLSEYTIGVKISLKNHLGESSTIDFSHMNLGKNTIYITESIAFDEVTDFNEVREQTKNSFNFIDSGYYQDVYYFVRAIDNSDFDFDIYLDYNDRSTKISSSRLLCDIAGENMVVQINGEPYYVKVLMLDEIYEMLEPGKLYALER